MEAWDVIIVGGGPAGTSTALHLVQRDASWAQRILVIEKQHHPRHKLCGGGITSYGIDVLTGLGLDLAEVPSVQIEDMQIVRGKHLQSLPRGFGLHVVRRNELDAWLAHHTTARGVTLHQGETVVAAKPHKKGVTVTTDQGSYEARVLVVADGSQGSLPRKLGLEEGGRTARALEILTPVSDPKAQALFDARIALFDFSASVADLQGYYWDFPCLVNGQPHINRGVYDARSVPDRQRADLRGILADYLARRDIAMEDIELMGHPIRWFDPEARISLPRVLLVGDAAGADPLIGEGIAFALAYGGVAAAAIADAFSQKDFRFGDYAARVGRSWHGHLLGERNAQARTIYRHRNPLMVRLFG